MPKTPPASPPRVALFATCLVDLTRPSVGFAAVKLLENAGCRVEVPAAQACCGQPAYNSGDAVDARAIARAVIRAFEGFDFVVAPSGSCAGMIRHHYPKLFAADAAMRERAVALAEKTFELVSFLTDVLGVETTDAEWQGSVTYHDSCSSLREMGVKRQPRVLLDKINGLILKECQESETCCGFGGLFCIKYPEISGRMVDVKVDDIVASGADTLLAGDLGCLMNMAGRLSRRGATVACRHVAEVLAGMTDDAPIGATETPPPGTEET